MFSESIGHRWPRCRSRAVALGSAVILLAGFGFVAAAPPASAALKTDTTTTSTLGQTLSPSASEQSCNSSTLVIDTSYVVPAGGGTITSFSYQSDPDQGPSGEGDLYDFGVFRPGSDGYDTVVGTTGLLAIQGTGLETFPVNIAVQAGDVLGLYAGWNSSGVGSPDENCFFAGSGAVAGLINRNNDNSYMVSGYLEAPGVGIEFGGPPPYGYAATGYDLNESANFVGAPPAAASSTAVACNPGSVLVGTSTTCTATVTGDGNQPVGTVAFSTNGTGTFNTSTCTLAAGGSDTASCSVTYTTGPVSTGTHTITAAYSTTDFATTNSSGSTPLTVTTNTSVSCTPSTVAVGYPTVCTATVTGTDPTGTDPTGTITFSASNVAGNNQAGKPTYIFKSTTCTLHAAGTGQSSCSVKYTPIQLGSPDSVTASYPGDVNNPVSAGFTTVGLTPGPTKTSISCPATAVVGQLTTCTVVVTDLAAGAEQPLGLIALANGDPGYFTLGFAVMDNVGPACTLQYQGFGSSDYCTFLYVPTAVGTQKMTAKFDAIPDDPDVEEGGYDSHHLPSQASTTFTAVGPSAGASASGQGTTSAQTSKVAVNPGDLVVAYVSADGPASGGQTATVSGGGLTWTRLAQANAQRGDSEVWTARAATAAKVAVTAKAGIKGYDIGVTAVTYQNATGAADAGTLVNGPPVVARTFNSPGGVPSATITTTGASSLVWAVGNDGAHATARKVGPGQTLDNEDLTSTPSTFWVQSATKDSPNTPNGGASVTINDTAPTADPYNLVVVEIL